MKNKLLLLGVLVTPLFNVHAQTIPSTSGPVHPPPKQPSRTGTPGKFEIIGESLVSAQQLFLGTENKIYIVDKVENNPTQINGHPAWASEYAVESNLQRPLDVVTNSFCAGGNVLGNGTWINVGGNQAVTYGGNAAERQDGGGPYNDPDGRRSIRLLDPCDSAECDWKISPLQSELRWYPSLETIEDGSIMILGGCRNGGYVNDRGQDNPTYEFFPPNGPSVVSPVLQRTLPVNLYPLTWLLPSGQILIQSNRETVLLDYKKSRETALDNIPDAVRTYPASAGTIMLPLTPANNWTATILFCGGSDVATDRWQSRDFIVVQQPASDSCVKITPDINKSYVHDDPLPEPRTMLNLIQLPDGTVLGLNGAKIGTAGYGNNTWAVGQSYADNPVLTPILYKPSAPAGRRWSSEGFSPSTVPRMYHSSATLLADGSVFVSGSNPNSDFSSDAKYPTEYRTERFYPAYFSKRRPQPVGLPVQLGYGGHSFNINLSKEDLFGNIDNVNETSVVIIRTGFSTHSINMGQRFVQLENTFTGFSSNGTAVLHVSQLPPNPAILAPGPALLFVVVNGVPSIGVKVMIGSGKIGAQTMVLIDDLPESSIIYQIDDEGSLAKHGPGQANRVNHSVEQVGLRAMLGFGVLLGFGLMGW